MPIPTGDLSGIKEGFEPLPAGKYYAEVTDSEERVADGSGKTPAGTPIIALEFTILDEEYEGRKAWVNVTFSEKAMGFVKSTLRGLGYTDEDFADPHLEVEADALAGRRCYLLLAKSTNPKTNQPNNKVVRVMALDEQEAELP